MESMEPRGMSSTQTYPSHFSLHYNEAMCSLHYNEPMCPIPIKKKK